MNKKKNTYKKGGKVPQYFLGGGLKKALPGLVSAGASFIPGAGPFLAPIAGMTAKAALNSGKNTKPTKLKSTADAFLGYAHGGTIPIGQDAIKFLGPSHENGGIQIPNAEVEGEETMDYIQFKNGGLVDSRKGSPYIFSKRLKLPDSSATFAQAHQRLVDKGASEDEIRNLAMLQEKVSGRSRGTGATIPDQTGSRGEKGYQRTKGDGGFYGMNWISDKGMKKDHKKVMQTGGLFGDPPLQRPPGFYVNQTGQASRYLPNTQKLLGAGQPSAGGSARTFQAPSSGPATVSGKPAPTKGTALGRPLNTVRTMSGPMKLLKALGKVAGPLGAGYATGEALQWAFGDDGGRGENEDFLNKLRASVGAEEVDPNDVPGDIVGPNYLAGLGPVPQQGGQISEAPPETSIPGAPQSPQVEAHQPTDEVVPDQVDTNYSPSIPDSGPIFETFGVSEATGFQTPTINKSPVPESDLVTNPDSTVAQATEAAGGGDEEGGFNSDLLQFVPEAMNFLTGALSDPDTPDATRVSDRSVGNFPTTVNVNPQLARNRDAFRQILNNPNATPAQRQAAMAQKMQADSAVFADKLNRENRLKANRAKLMASLDRQNAQYANQARTERMQADAMFGPTGNMARGAVSNAAQKALMLQAQRNKEKADQTSAMAIMSQLDPALQKKLAKQLGLLNG